MYKVIKHFRDLQDKNYPYNVGDEFPRKGMKVKKERFEELAGKDNKQGVPLIKKVDDAPGAAESEEAETTEELADN